MMLPAIAPACALAATEALLLSGGDERLLADPVSGVSPYGCRATPEPDLIALGSSTASTISGAGFAAATALRNGCLAQLRRQSDVAVYTQHNARVRAELLQLCGFTDADQVSAVLAASGTDLHLLVGQWLQPDRIVMIAPSETGSGVPAAMQGRHFRRRAAYRGSIPATAPMVGWQAQLMTIQPRHADGSLRSAAELDGECSDAVAIAVAAGESVLLVVTDLSKTGLIIPSPALAQRLKKRWPTQVEIMVDACQFRLARATVREYVAAGFLVAITGSKFLGGPTFCGALLIPPALASRYRHRLFGPDLGAYSCAADWPADWACGQSLPPASNFGLLLRWQAALTEFSAFAALPGTAITSFLRQFGASVREIFGAHACFEEVSVSPLIRMTPAATARWDAQATIFPFVLRCPDGIGGLRYLNRSETEKIYIDLQHPQNPGVRRFYLGQPVDCGQREGTTRVALRLCVSAPMIVAACTGGNWLKVIADTRAALTEIRRAVGQFNA